MANGFVAKIGGRVDDTVQFNAGRSLEAIPASRSPELGQSTTIRELLDNGMIPGVDGVGLNQRTVIFSDLWRLSEMHNIEFALTKEPGKWRLYSGSHVGVSTPLSANIRVLAHTHPRGAQTPSPKDITSLNTIYDEQLLLNPSKIASPSRVIYGPKINDYTPFWPTNR